MAEVSNELIYKLMLDIQAEQRQMRAEQDVISQKIGTTAETLVGIKREISVINSRLDSLDPASFFEKKQTIDNATKVANFGTLYWAHLRLGRLNRPKFYCVRGGFRR